MCFSLHLFTGVCVEGAVYCQPDLLKKVVFQGTQIIFIFSLITVRRCPHRAEVEVERWVKQTQYLRI